MNLQSRIDKLFETVGNTRLFGGATMEDFAKAHPFSKDKTRLRKASIGVRRLAAGAALSMYWHKWTRAKYADKRPEILAKLSLPTDATLEDIRRRIIELGWECGFNQHEIGWLEKGMPERRADVA
jgi:hypothetical protein